MGVGELSLEIERLKNALRQSFQNVKEDINSNSSKIQHTNAKIGQIEAYFSVIQEQISIITNNLVESSKEDSLKEQAIKQSINEFKKSMISIHSLLTELKERQRERETSSLHELNSVKSGIQNVVIGLYQKLDTLESSIRDLEKAHNVKLTSSIEKLEKMIEPRIESLKKSIISKDDIKLLVQQAVQESLKGMLKDIAKKPETSKKESKLQQQMLKKIGKNKKAIIKQKIMDILSVRNISLPELKEIIVDDNGYCSKASFYRYIEELRKRGILEVVEVDSIKTITINGNK